MFYVYMLASRRNGTLYIGSTDDLRARVADHKWKRYPQSFTARYNITQLVWFEPHESRHSAFSRERAMKQWYRIWKLRLIEAENPDWRCLYEDLGPAIE